VVRGRRGGGGRVRGLRFLLQIRVRCVEEMM